MTTDCGTQKARLRRRASQRVGCPCCPESARGAPARRRMARLEAKETKSLDAWLDMRECGPWAPCAHCAQGFDPETYSAHEDGLAFYGMVYPDDYACRERVVTPLGSLLDLRQNGSPL